MAKDLVTIFGGSGFVGKNIVEQLAAKGYRVRVAVRNPNSALFVKPLGDVGQVQVVQANLRDEKSVFAAIQGSDVVINLVGILFESGKQSFSSVHASGAALIAKFSADLDVKKLIHMSAIGADAESEALYAKTKAKGEEAVRHYYPDAVIFRPSIIFGPDDGFFNRFGNMAKLSPIMPVISGDSKFQPVYVCDVAEAFVKAVEDDVCDGQTYTLGGPRTYSFRELLAYICEETDNDRTLVDIPMPIAKIQAVFMGLLPTPPLTLDQLTMLEKDNVVGEGEQGFDALGINPTPVEAVVPSYMWQYRPKGQFVVE